MPAEDPAAEPKIRPRAGPDGWSGAEDINWRSARSRARLRRALVRGGQFLLDELAPPSCLFCDQSSPRDLPLCHFCLDRLNRNDQACPGCALPLCRGMLCPNCQKGSGAGISISAPYIYDASLAYLMSRWKYHSERRLSRVAAYLMLSGATAPASTDALLPVPLHWRRQLLRGFNQSEDLLHDIVRQQPELAAAANTPLALTRRRATPAQAAMSRRERQVNLDRAFCIRGNTAGQRITLIDDVCTTGATAQAAADTLLKAGALEVQLWCLARTPAP